MFSVQIITIDESLNWKNHINVVKSKLCKVASVLHKVSHCVDRYSLHTLCCSLVLPNLMYCSEIWGNNYKTNIQCIALVQKRVVRLIHGANRLDHTNILFYNSRILKFVDIVEFKTALFMHSAYYNMLPNNFDKMMEKCISLRSSRRTHQFARENIRTDMRKLALPLCVESTNSHQYGTP